MPVPPHLWQRTILSPFLSVPFPSQFLHGFFFSTVLLLMSFDPSQTFAGSAFVLERECDAGSKCQDLSVLHPHVHLGDLGNA